MTFTTVKHIVNLTSHTIDFPELGISIPPEQYPARIDAEVVDLGIDVAGKIPLTINTDRYIVGLPPRKKDTVYIVSMMVAQAAKTREDLLIVNEAIRNEKGQIIGAKSLTYIYEDASL